MRRTRTAVAGIIAATADPNHTDDFSGVAPEADLISIRQSSTSSAPLLIRPPRASGTSTPWRERNYSADLGASVINISSVACARVGSALDDRALGAALAYAVDVKNTVVVVAAGNVGAGQCPAQQADATRTQRRWW